MEKEKATTLVVIPIYCSQLPTIEAEALENNLKKLAELPIVFLRPASLDISQLRSLYPQVGEVVVSDCWLGSRGITGYNEMMLSPDFYRLFSAYDFILICHTDAWVFRNDVAFWTSLPYDHVAAPWPQKIIYNFLPMRLLCRAIKYLCGYKGLIRQDSFGRVGNGGFSLRRVQAFIDVCERERSQINDFLQHNGQGMNNGIFYNEDVYFAIVASQLRTPSQCKALAFAFDNKPSLAWRLNKKQLPMAIHGFKKTINIDFWQRAKEMDCQQ